jgi:hypothetical protein
VLVSLNSGNFPVNAQAGDADIRVYGCSGKIIGAQSVAVSTT